MEEQEISETGQDGAADSTVQLKQWNPGQDPDQWGADTCQISERQFRKVSQSQSISSRWDTYTCEIKEHQSRKVSRWDGSVPWAFFWKNLSPCNTLTKVSYKLSGIKILSVSQKKDVSSIKIHNLWWVWSQSIRLKNQNCRKFLVLFFLKLTDNLIIVWLIWGLHLCIIVFSSKCEEQSELIRKLKKELEDLKSQNERLQSQKDNDCKSYIHCTSYTVNSYIIHRELSLELIFFNLLLNTKCKLTFNFI